ncbi:xin actin-binding repeat-containing protein 1 isoform 2-T2 [Syngnathus typhle]
METFGLRRTQSLKSLSWVQERSRDMPAPTRWDRKSVLQLVHHYQSCGDLRSQERMGHNFQTSERFFEEGWRGVKNRDNVALEGALRAASLSRSHSMDFLPERENSGTRALCALFESKAKLQHKSSCSPKLNSSVFARDGKTGRDCPLQDQRSHNRSAQKVTQSESGRTTDGLPESYNKDSRYSYDDKQSTFTSLTKRGIPTTQASSTTSTCSSVRDKSARYLSKAASIDSVGAELIATSVTRVKSSKMAETARKVKVLESSHDEDDLPLPPPPPRPFDYEGPSALSGLPVPPPKETFSTYYQQRQKSELKRLFKHIHPDIRHLGEAVDDDIMKAVQPEDTEATAAYQGEVQSMRWIFENWNLDSIGESHATKKLLDEENLAGGNVRGTSSMFEHCDDRALISEAKRQTSVRGDVRASTWLFETKPLDSLNQKEDGELVEAVLKEPIRPGDVSGTRLLFETKPISDLARCNSIEDNTFLKLTSEIQEQKGDVQKTVKLFQAEPSCAIRDKSGNIHTIKSICREEIKNGNTSSARWLFETKPLDLINKGSDGIKIIRGISLEEGHRGGVDRKRWMFETQSFDNIQEVAGLDTFEDTLVEGDVSNKTKLFEMQPLSEKTLEKDTIIGGDVKTSLWLFETQPIETLNDSYEVGCLKKITLSADEQGAIKDKKIMFESGGGRETSSSVKQRVTERGDVMGFKQLFETIPLSEIAHCKEENTSGNQMSENSPLYAIKDSSGNFHKITTVSREEFIKGKVQNYKWMFETKPLDELTEGKENIEVIKGITREEDTMGDVKLAKWLFETQTMDGIHSKFNQKEPSPSVGATPCKGDVKACKWLFETQPMDVLYDKSEKVNDKETIENTGVKSMTWLFESQPLDSIKDGEEYNLNLCSTVQDAVKPKSAVQTVKRLFETETLDRTRNEQTEQDVRCVSQVDFQSGDVSRVKELFESQSLDEIGSEMVMTRGDEHIQKGSVHKFTWLFENCPINTINKDDDDTNIPKPSETVSGDVKNKKFIFETSSLDKIHEEPLEHKSVSLEELESDVDVKSSTMMFESLPLYAIQDKEGQFHEVTTVKKDEVLSGDVRGARWMFETKPLEAIKAENEVYVIRAVTQEDVEKGDVKSARWKFETQPLDSFTSREEPSVKISEDFGSSNVQLSKKKFESEESNKFVRMVSVTDVQRGDVRTSTWLFENQTIDSLKGEPQDQGPVKTVHREDSQKGDVKRCTWLFESQPLDKIKEPEERSFQGSDEIIPKADVKCTTWLFETTPLDKITSSSVTDTMSSLSESNIVHSSGIIVEAKEGPNVTMAKFSLGTTAEVQIQKEEVVEGNLRNIILQLLLKPSNTQVTLLREMEKGNVNTTKIQLPHNQSSTSIAIDREQILQNTVQMIDELLMRGQDFKKGILMQETAGGQAEMSVYSLIAHETDTQSAIIERGDVKSAIGNLLASASNPKTAPTCRVDENEKGNVNFYKRCIEKGDLQCLKSLQSEASEDDVDDVTLGKEQIEIIQGDVREAKRSLCQQKEVVERSICDVLPGDVKKTKEVFSSECSFIAENCIPRDEIIPGDVLTAKQQLAAKQAVLMEKEEIVAGDVKASMQSLERAKQLSMSIERESITPGTIYDMDLSSNCPEPEGSQVQKETIISGDVKAAKKSLQLAKQQSMQGERDVIAPGKIYNLHVAAQEGSSARITQSSSYCRSQQSKTCPQVSDAVKDLESRMSLDACHRGNNDFLSYECNGMTTQDEPEDVIRGDIKSALRSLRSAVTEQRLPDKEAIVGGHVHLALQSLERSNVNVSKGDFRSAMLYRNSGKACTERSKQSVALSMPPSDTTLFPSISVMGEGQPSFAVNNSTCNPVQNGGSPGLLKKPQNPKPTLPPKPQWTKPAVIGDSKLSPANKCNPVSAKHDLQLPTDKFIEDTTAASKQNAKPNSTKLEVERNVIQKINAAEEIQKCMEEYEDTSKHEMNMSLQAALSNFERTDSKKVKGPKKVINVKGEVKKPIQNTSAAKNCSSILSPPEKQFCKSDESDASTCHTTKSTIDNENKVILRQKKPSETESQRRQRLSVHMDEIIKGNVKAAMEIFENMRKREELKGILSQVQEIEGANSHVDVSSSSNHVPPSEKSKQSKVETQDDDLESVSSVETVFEDLEKASKEIINLKEQTLAKLLDIEEAIKKALYSVSNLKSEADIAGLSGLFDESLKSEQPVTNIRKISIVSSRTKSGQGKDTRNHPGDSNLLKQEATKQANNQVIRQPSSQSSPSFISIHSAARKPLQQPKPAMSTESNCQGDPNQGSTKRKVSVLEVQTLPEEPADIIGTKTVSETYKETDGFGNVFLSSVTSTFVTKQSDGESAAVFEVVGGPNTYKVITSPLLQRSPRPSSRDQ